MGARRQIEMGIKLDRIHAGQGESRNPARVIQDRKLMDKKVTLPGRIFRNSVVSDAKGNFLVLR